MHVHADRDRRVAAGEAARGDEDVVDATSTPSPPNSAGDRRREVAGALERVDAGVRERRLAVVLRRRASPARRRASRRAATRRAPASRLGGELDTSGGDDPDFDRHAVRDHVEDGGAAPARARRSRAASPRGASPLILKFTRMREKPLRTSSERPRRAADVHVALERRLDLGQPHLARGGDVHERRRQAGGERVQQVLGRVRAGVGAEQDRGLAGVDGERLGARAVLLPGAVERT